MGFVFITFRGRFQQFISEIVNNLQPDRTVLQVSTHKPFHGIFHHLNQGIPAGTHRFYSIQIIWKLP